MADNESPQRCDLAITNALLITVDEQRRIYSRGAVAIEAGRIVAVGRHDDIVSRFQADHTLDASGGIVHPGFIEPHIHISQYHSRAAASVFHTPGTSLRYAQWKAELHDDDEFSATVVGCLELLRGGFTSFVDPGTVFAPDSVAAAAEAAGLRGWLCDPYLWDYSDTFELYPHVDQRRS